jgi:hypothetical protein
MGPFFKFFRGYNDIRTQKEYVNASLRWLKEVLRRENQRLQVYPVDDSAVFSMTGTYFWFVLSMLSGLIYKKKRLRPVRSFTVTPPMQSNNFKIQNRTVEGGRQMLCMTPSPRQSPKENK